MLKEILNQKIKDSSHEELKQKLGYQSTKKLENSVNKFLQTKTIYEWLNSGFYDLVYDSIGFLNKLCKEFDIDKKFYNEELEKCQKLKVEMERFKDAYIFVNTNFKRVSEPIFALALLESKRRVSLYKDEKYLFKSIDEILNITSIFIEEHYKENGGKLAIWKDIINYQLHLFDEIYTFEVTGELTNIKENYDVNIASIKLK